MILRRALLLAALVACARPAHAAPSSADLREFAALVAAANAIDQNLDPPAYKAAMTRAIARGEAIHPPGSLEVERLRIRLQVARFALGELDGLAEDIERTRAVLAAAGPAGHSDLVDVTNNLAVVIQARGDDARALELNREAIALRRRIVGQAADGYLAVMIGNLAWTQRALGDYPAALANAREGVAMLEQVRRDQPDERDVADALTVALTNLQLHLADMGLRAEAAEAARALVARLDSLTGAESPSTANLLINAASHLANDGKQAEAEAMVRRAVALRERGLGMDAGPTHAARLRLVTMLTSQGRWAEALPIAEAATAGLEAKLGPAASETLEGRGKIARIAFALGDEARGLAEMRALVASAKARLRPGHRDLLDNQEYLATMLARAGQWRESAEVLADLAQGRAAGGIAPSPRTAPAEALMAMAEARLGQRQAALDRLAALRPRLDGWFAEEVAREGARGGRQVALNRAIGLAALASADAGDTEAAFALAQRHGLGPSDRAVLRARQREGAGDAGLAERLREVQDLTERRDRAMAAFGRAATSGNPASARAAKELAERLDAEIERLGVRAPPVPPPPRLADLRAGLGADEAVLLVLETEIATRLFALSSKGLAVADAGLPTSRIGELVGSLRQRLDWGSDTDTPFDPRESHALHAALFVPAVARLLDGHARVSVVARGALGRVPFAVLSRPRRDGGIEWAASRHAFAYPVGLDHVGTKAVGKAAFSRFIGIGAPALPEAAGAGEVRLRAFRGAANGLRIAGLGALAMAQGELRAMAEALDAGDSLILAGARAREAELRATDLSRADILTFATHGVTAGELDGLDEAALVLSPPAIGDPAGDDGLLTTTEIAALRLDARLVVLSACNSASGDRAGDEALGGLAHAFLYAGADALMVSHWRVRDDAAARLTVATARGMARGLDPANALRRAQLALMASRDLPGASHPAVWAPFVVVGE